MIDFRMIDRKKYPELGGYNNAQLYDYFIGCGGLFLVVEMTRKMNLKPGDIVLDLGCGFGSASLYLAKTFGVTVIGVDFWFPPEKMNDRIHHEGLSNKVIPLNIDITQNIPFAENYFDAIFCMNSFFIYGENSDFIKKITGSLKAGGTFCIGGECFNQEPTYKRKEDIPEAYNFEWNWDAWDTCFSKYHSPEWWRSKIEETGLLNIKYCKELDYGVIFFEDIALNYYHYFNEHVLSIGAMIPQGRIVNTILQGRVAFPYPTLYVLSAIKK
ncbi:MAG TPA: methyltransferase domain-containing protein [Chitinispirillaceae bacterium]|nr:methyltransferase domain-containing protein [Chitinispirillaceae bacterium]